MQVLSSLLFFNLICQFVARKLGEVGSKIDAYFVTSFLYTFVLTVVSFSFMYLGLQRIDSSHFSLPEGWNFWYFLSYSLNTIMTAELSGVTPQTHIARLLTNLELVGGLMLLVILVLVFLTILRERYQRDVSDLIDELYRSENVIGELIKKDYQISMSEAETQVAQSDPKFIPMVEYLRGKDSIWRAKKEENADQERKETDEEEGARRKDQ